MTDIYKKHEKAFARVSAYVLMKGGEQLGTVAFKYPQGGAGRLTCYLHFHTLPMVTGTASGYGYDKALAAFESATENCSHLRDGNGNAFYGRVPTLIRLMNEAFKKNGGARDWQQVLREQGVQALKAV